MRNYLIAATLLSSTCVANAATCKSAYAEMKGNTYNYELPVMVEGYKRKLALAYENFDMNSVTTMHSGPGLLLCNVRGTVNGTIALNINDKGVSLDGRSTETDIPIMLHVADNGNVTRTTVLYSVMQMPFVYILTWVSRTSELCSLAKKNPKHATKALKTLYDVQGLTDPDTDCANWDMPEIYTSLALVNDHAQLEYRNQHNKWLYSGLMSPKPSHDPIDWTYEFEYKVQVNANDLFPLAGIRR